MLTRHDVAYLQRSVGNSAVSRLLTSRPTGHVIQREIDVSYIDAAPVPATPIGVKITGSFLADTSKVQLPPGQGHGPQQARHIVPNDLVRRATEAEFNGKSASFFQTYRGFNAAHPGGFRAAVRELVNGELVYKNTRLNKDMLWGASWMPPITAHASHSNDNRNYWMGDAHLNQYRNYANTSMQVLIDQQWATAALGNNAAAVNVASPAYLNYKNATNHANSMMLSQEFDPPPGKTKAEYNQMGEAWAGFTNDWFANDPLAKLKHCPSKYLDAHQNAQVTSELAYYHPDSKTMYTNAP